jgi:hypothetical protein
MNREDAPPTDEERREAELLARALDQPARPARDVDAVEDALGAAWMVRASRTLELAEPGGRAVLERVWRKWRFRRRAAGIVAIAAAAAVALFMVRSRSTTHLPAPGVDLLRAQLAAARPGSDAAFARFEEEHAKYRGQLYAALRRAYGRRP